MKKRIWVIALLLVLIFILVPVIHLLRTRWQEIDEKTKTPHGYVNDASGLNLTKVDTVVEINPNKTEAEKQLKGIIQYAQEKKLKISLAGARHSMGGHTMYTGGVVINMLPYNHMELDTATSILTIGAGALWQDALAYLDKYQKSIAIMQAFSSFSVGGSISVNGHGWQKNLPPVSSSVVEFTLMNYKGDVLTCSRTENTELFKLVLGGYGLFGIILDIKLKVVNNIALQAKYIKLATTNYVANYKKFILANPNVNLVFGRLRISKKHFLEEAILNFFEQTNEKPLSLKQTDENDQELKRLVFRGSVNSEYGKRLRWDLETGMNKVSGHSILSRNELLNDHVSLIENKDTTSTDLLQEYFIPERNFTRYINDIKSILLNSKIDLLNITIRAVCRDTDSYMNYAREDVFGFVFLFNQKKTPEQENQMKALTNQLFNATIHNEGTFYLPYRLHISREKMRKSYPQADAFFELKRKYDPLEIFNNKFYEHYK